MSMTKAQRAEYRHTLECVLACARKRAIESGLEMIVYRACNGFWMYGRWQQYTAIKGDKFHKRVHIDGTWEDTTDV